MCFKVMRRLLISILYGALLSTHLQYWSPKRILASMPDRTLHFADAGLPRSPCAAGAVVDLRSDTVTLPTPSMYARMQTAALGDDGLDGDPTVRALEALAASMLGKESALYVPTATMGNLLAVLSQAERRSQVVLEEFAHMFVSERGGAVFSGVTYTGIPGVAGA